ncbi:MAG: hypothetical protein OXH07_05720 [Chloroflexi bacterium]|nr:hypothetical protein [Chloroflexota bacterium]
MNWWVYEDDATSWARVHRAICAHCNDGRGHYGTRRPDNRWHGPFPTREEAIEKALSTGKRDVKGCGTCLPELRFLG